jgi:hypothetical protein
MSFWQRWFFYVSTPTCNGTGRITQANYERYEKQRGCINCGRRRVQFWDSGQTIGELKFVGMFVRQLWRGPDYRARAA